jgi:hypothetical protein
MTSRLAFRAASRRALSILPVLSLAACGGELDEANTGNPGGPVEEVTAALTGTWTFFTHGPSTSLGTCLLLTNGNVMCHESSTNRWHRLTPDNTGSYKNGTWDATPIPPMPPGNDSSGCVNCTYAPLYFASAVLPSGNVVVIGGEYNGAGPPETSIGFVYDPLNNSWSSQLQEVFGTGNVGDAKGTVLQDGRFLLTNRTNTNMEVLNTTTNAFSALNPTGKLDKNSEESWNILYDGTVLTVDSWTTSASFERYTPSSNSWGNSGTTPVRLTDNGTGLGTSGEVGPCVLRPDSKLFCFSGNSLGKNALYDTATNTWSHTASMDFPAGPSGGHFAMADGPAAALPNGNILAMASPVLDTSTYNPPSHFYEVTLTSNTVVQVADTPSSPLVASYNGRMLVLPTGEVLLTGFDDTMLYSNGGAPAGNARPSVSTSPSMIAAGGVYSISGRQLNGYSEGASYGDDAQMATNYPLVRLTNTATGHVSYARTYNHSRMGVEPVGSTTSVSTTFQVPVGYENGPSTIEVVANGIASPSVSTSGRFTSLTLQNGWTAYGGYTPSASNDGGIVQLRGGVTTTGTSISPFTLPAGFRPSAAVYVQTDLVNATPGRVIIYPSGVVTVEDAGTGTTNASRFTSLDGVSFATTATGFTALTLQNGWTNAPFSTRNAAVKNDGGLIRFQGAIAAPSGSSPMPFVLPAAFRPPTDTFVQADLCDGYKGVLVLHADGTVAVFAYNLDPSLPTCFTSLEGVTFAASASGYTAATLQNGWVNAVFSTRNVAFKNDGGIVRFEGAVGNGTAATIFTLPADLRLPRTMYVNINLCGGRQGRIDVSADGRVSVEVPSSGAFTDATCFTSLEGASFAFGS